MKEAWGNKTIIKYRAERKANTWKILEPYEGFQGDTDNRFTIRQIYEIN